MNGIVIWLTGLSGAGKTTLAEALRDALLSRDFMACVLDGDIIRNGLSADLGFSQSDRSENNRRVAEVAKIIGGLGVVVIVALISPLCVDRQAARSIIESDGVKFREVYVNTPLAICEQRDPKGYYSRARSRQLDNFTGIDSLYEEPPFPDVVVYPAAEAVATSVARVMQVIASAKLDRTSVAPI